MKKALCLILSLWFVVFLVGCKSVGKNITVADSGYTCTAEINYAEYKTTANLNVRGGGVFTLSVMEPLEVKGLEFAFNSGKMKVSYEDLESNFYKSSEQFGFAKLISGVFLKLTTGRPEVPQKNGVYILEGISEGYNFMLTVDEKGFPEKLKIPSAELEVEFYDFKY